MAAGFRQLLALSHPPDTRPYSDQPPGTTPDDTQVGNFNFNDGLANGYNDGYALTGSTTFSATQNYLTDVGVYTSSPSYYGTFDQGGNVTEWHESIIVGGGWNRGVRGGAWLDPAEVLSANFRFFTSPTIEFDNYGFRIAAIVPEPGIAVLLFVGGVATLLPRRLCNSARC